ncbi:uncharacterized protein LOC123528659 [Mercenaria mercenaria]|uniref:uncharacterized protein LOC123528659 n=1 Tax=Mercenaria mercenaria TaxID=6596 RepID=UPI00234EC629|nr:uncharacterized protein LOC123528659 [Mercenaria mercenaria]
MKCEYTQVIHILVSMLSFVATFGQSSTCPPNPHEKVQQCTDNVLPNLNQQTEAGAPETYRTHVQHASETCRDSRLRDVADCIQDILDRCRGTTDAEQTLQRLIDKDKVVNTVDYFCRHIRVYEEHAECIAKHHEETSNCSKEAHKSFRAKVNAGANIDVLIMGTCRFHAVARGCLTNTTQLHCGGSAANFVYTLLTGLMPPFCETMNPEYSHVHTTRSFNTEGRRNQVESSAVYMKALIIPSFLYSFVILFRYYFI